MDFPEDEKKKWIEWEIKSKVFLKDKKLERKIYSDLLDHRHCEFCWGKFSQNPDDMQVGYFEKEYGCWICDECYDIFNSYFQWKIK